MYNIQLLSSSDCKTFSPQPVVATLSNAVCRRATTLHTAKCTDSSAGCYSGNSVGSTITYGSKGTSGSLSSGDAFDCDVNNDGVYDEDTERFYYVTSNGDNAVLIYYSNVSSEVLPSNFNSE